MLAAPKVEYAKDGEFEETTATLETSEEEKTDTAAAIIAEYDVEVVTTTPEAVLLNQPNAENESGDNLAPSDCDTTAEVEAPWADPIYNIGSIYFL